VSAPAQEATVTRAFRTAACVLLAACAAAAALAQTPTDGTTPIGMTPGAPAGSYPLSGFESVNYFNGGLSFALPLLQIGGRGDVQTTVTLPIEQKWSVKLQPGGYWDPVQNDWTEVPPGRSPGVVQGRSVSKYIHFCDQGLSASYTGLTRLSFVSADGTEHELRDTVYGGKPVEVFCGGGTSRGNVFTSADGTAMTFVSDFPLSDGYIGEDYWATTFSPSGRLFFRDGTEYRVYQGQVTEVRDRNGNRITYEYDQPFSSRVRRIVDPLQRETTFTWDPDGAWERIDFKGFGGAPRSITIEYAHLSELFPEDRDYCIDPPVRCAWNTGELFPEIMDGPAALHDPLVVSQVVLPNGQAYSFQYNPYGELEQVFLPTGGRFRYTWGGGIEGGPDSGYINLGEHRIYRRVLQREVYGGEDDDTLELVTTISRPEGRLGQPQDRVDVEQRDAGGSLLRREEHFFHGAATRSMTLGGLEYPGYREGRERLTKVYDAAGTLMETTENTWEQRPPGVEWGHALPEEEPPLDTRLATRKVTLGPSGPSRLEHYSYDDFNNQTEVAEYDFGVDLTGAPARRRQTEYLVTNPVNGVIYPNLPNHLRGLPRLQRVLDGSGAERSRTTYEYDNYASDVNHAPLTATPGVAGQVSGFGTGNVVRGNCTGTIRTWDHDPFPSPTGQVTTYQRYDAVGNILWLRDANGNVTTTSFDDAFGVPDNEVNGNTPPAELGGLSTFAFPTWVTDPKQHSGRFQYDYYLGRAVNWLDPNAVVGSAAYDDALDRPTEQVVARTGPAGATAARAATRFAYQDGFDTRVTTTRDKDAYGDQKLKGMVRYDGLGRAIQTRTYESPTVFLFKFTEYDGLGRVVKVYNPLRSDDLPPDPWPSTATTYDALDRIVDVLTPDDAHHRSAYTGNVTTTTDPAGKVRVLTSDALGRVTSIVEDPSGLNYATSYQYEADDQVKRVAQGAQVRTFAYDNLGRLFQATTPEAGTVDYTHWRGGQVRTRRDGRSVTATYNYDPLNRLDAVSYSDGTPAVDYVWDELGSTTIPFSIGRLVQVGSAASTTRFGAFDAVGRVKTSHQTTGSQTYDFGYDYDRAGNLKSETYPSARVLTFTYDDASRPSSVSQGPTAFASGALYAPHGGLSDLTLGNGLLERNRFNLRLQPRLVTLGTASADVFRLDYGDYGGAANNGNLLSQSIYHGATGATWAQTYTYDGANRLKTINEAAAGGPAWSQTYGYDRFGNRWVPSSGLPLSSLTPTAAGEFNAATNRLTTPNLYDLAGNHTRDELGRTFTFDAESHQVTFGDGSTSATYVYDGEGRRVRATVQGATTTFVYDAFGRLAGQYGRATAEQRTGVQYLTGDHLGSTRVVTDGNAAVIARHDYLPFGEELGPSVNGRGALYAGGDTVRQLFTGKERDAESALDYFGARYFSAPLGRFTGVDPVLSTRESSADPQRWNRYAYVRNNPLRLVDPDGRCSAPAGIGGSKVGICIESFISARSLDQVPFAFGDNRPFDAHLPYSYKAQILLTYDVKTGFVDVESAAAGISYVGIPALDLKSQPGVPGTLDVKLTSFQEHPGGPTRFNLTYSAANGSSRVATIIPPIDASLTFDASPDGSVRIDLGSSRADTYPSHAAYSYRMIEGLDVATPLLEVLEQSIGGLFREMEPLQGREQQGKSQKQEKKETEKMQQSQ
jgi:RHS repeat-associated protein